MENTGGWREARDSHAVYGEAPRCRHLRVVVSAGRSVNDDIRSEKARGTSAERAALVWIDIDYIARATRATRDMAGRRKG